MDLKQALLSMDTLDDSLWTNDGFPKIDVLREMTGDKSITRQHVINIAPKYSRGNISIGEGHAQGEEVRQEEEVNVHGVVSRYLAGEPLMPEKFALLLREASDEELEDLDKILEEQMDQADKTRQAAEDLYKIVRVSSSMTKVAIRQRIPDVDNQTAIREYIEAQNRARASRFAAAQEIKELVGRDISKLDPRSPIDRAMARKTAHGANRPRKV